SDDWCELLERTGGIAPDLIGFGRSSKAANLDYTLDGLATFLERVLDELGLERITLVGHDWGAAVGLVFAQRHPDAIDRLVLCDERARSGRGRRVARAAADAGTRPVGRAGPVAPADVRRGLRASSRARRG